MKLIDFDIFFKYEYLFVSSFNCFSLDLDIPQHDYIIC